MLPEVVHGGLVDRLVQHVDGTGPEGEVGGPQVFGQEGEYALEVLGRLHRLDLLPDALDGPLAAELRLPATRRERLQLRHDLRRLLRERIPAVRLAGGGRRDQQEKERLSRVRQTLSPRRSQRNGPADCLTKPQVSAKA